MNGQIAYLSEPYNNRDQSHLTLTGNTANILFWRRVSCIGSAMAPLDRALLTSYRLSRVTILPSVMVWPQFALQIF